MELMELTSVPRSLWISDVCVQMQGWMGGEVWECIMYAQWEDRKDFARNDDVVPVL